MCGEFLEGGVRNLYGEIRGSFLEKVVLKVNFGGWRGFLKGGLWGKGFLDGGYSTG